MARIDHGFTKVCNMFFALARGDGRHNHKTGEQKNPKKPKTDIIMDMDKTTQGQGKALLRARCKIYKRRQNRVGGVAIIYTQFNSMYPYFVEHNMKLFIYSLF